MLQMIMTAMQAFQVMFAIDQLYYCVPDRGSEYCDDGVCLSDCVCLSASMSLELQVRSSPKFLCMLPVAVDRSSSGDVAMLFFSGEGMTSYLHIMPLHCFIAVFQMFTCVC